MSRGVTTGGAPCLPLFGSVDPGLGEDDLKCLDEGSREALVAASRRSRSDPTEYLAVVGRVLRTPALPARARNSLRASMVAGLGQGRFLRAVENGLAQEVSTCRAALEVVAQDQDRSREAARSFTVRRERLECLVTALGHAAATGDSVRDEIVRVFCDAGRRVREIDGLSAGLRAKLQRAVEQPRSPRLSVGVWVSRFAFAAMLVASMVALATVATRGHDQVPVVAEPPASRGLVDAFAATPGRSKLVRIGRLAVAATPITQRQFTHKFAKSVLCSKDDDARGPVPCRPLENLSRFLGDPDNPVEQVTIIDALQYANRLSAEEGLTLCYQRGESLWTVVEGCDGYRLPSNAEFEAMRGQSPDDLSAYAWFLGNSRVLDPNAHDCSSALQQPSRSSFCATRPVEKRQPNEHGLYDVEGNVAEWTLDDRVMDARKLQTYQGCAFSETETTCRERSVRKLPGTERVPWLGFRVVRTLN